MSAPIAASAIPYAHWSMKVGRRSAALGEIVHQIADLEQGIANLVFTPIGSVPTEPEKGCDILPYLDRPPAIAVPRLVEAIWTGLIRWHKRIRLESVEVLPVADGGESGFSHFRVPLFWFPVDGVVEEALRTELELGRDSFSAAGVLA